MEALGQIFQQVYISGNARAHLGNHYGIEEDGVSRATRLKDILRPTVLAPDQFDSISRTKALESVAGSGDWILQEPLYIRWKSGDSVILWVHGKPGSGKTFLAHRIIEDIQSRSTKDGSQASTAYFFFQAGNAQAQSVHQALRDISYQLCEQNGDYAAYVLEHYTTLGDIPTISSVWRNLFKRPFLELECASSCYIVLDGLDELPTEQCEAILQLLMDLDRAGKHGVHVLMLGRTEITEKLDNIFQNTPLIHVDSTKTSADICRYIDAALERSRTLRQLPGHAKEKVAKTLAEHTAGMFLYAKLVISELAKKRRTSAVLDALHVLPIGITSMLDHILGNLLRTMSKEDVDDLNHVISWVTYAETTVTGHMVSEILRIASSANDAVLDMESRITYDYSSLLELGPTDDALSFSHTAVLEYFKAERPFVSSSSQGCPSIVGLCKDEAHFQIASTSLKIATCQACPIDNSELGQIEWYARAFWMNHCSTIEPENIERRQLQKLVSSIRRALTDRAILDGPLSWIDFTLRSDWTAQKADRILKVLQHFQEPGESTTYCSETSELGALSLFEPAMLSMARRWLLTRPGHPGSRRCVEIIHSYLQQAADSTSEEATNLDYEQILNTARWAGFKEDLSWHGRLIQALTEFKLADAALWHYQRYMEDDVNKSLFPGGLCLLGSIQMQRRQWPAALTAFSRALEMLPICTKVDTQATSWTQAVSAHGITECCDLLIACGQRTRSYERARLKYEASCHLMAGYKADAYIKDDRRTSQAVMHLADIAWDQQSGVLHTIVPDLAVALNPLPSTEQCFRLIYRFLCELHGTRNRRRIFVDSIQRSYLICFLTNQRGWLREFTRVAAWAAKTCSCLPWLLDRYQEALGATDFHTHRFNLRNVAIQLELATDTALIYTAYQNSAEEALSILMSTVAEVNLDNTDQQVQEFYSLALQQIADCSLRSALEMPAHSDALLASLTKIIQEHIDGSKMSRTLVRRSRAEIGLASWLMRDGRSDQAFEIFRTYLIRYANRLRSKSISVIINALPRMGKVLCCAGDDNNAIAAFNAVTPFVLVSTKLRRHNHANMHFSGMAESVLSSALLRTYPSKEVNDIVVCDGPCRRHYITYEGMFVCRNCIDTDYCSDCYTLLRNDAIPFTECHKDHDFLSVPRLPDGMELKMGNVPLRRGVVDDKTWLTALLERWEIPWVP